MIRLRTLGALELRGSDERELHLVLAQPKRVALLAYLALATPRGMHRRDTLLALFWPEHDSEHARNSLSQSIHVLRQALGADVLAGRNADALGLEGKDFWCDAVAFEHALDAGRIADGVELYRGDLLQGFHIAGAPEFERWLASERERLGQRFMVALEALADEREGAGDFAGASAWWRRLAGRDPYSSRIALRLMRALAAAGDPAGAVRHARLHETLLREELDIAPDREVAALVSELQSASTAAPPNGSRSPDRSTDDRVETATVASAPAPAPPPPAHHRSGWRPRSAILAACLTLLGAVGAAEAVLRTRGEPVPARVIRSLAVLPLEDLSSDSAHPFFADGLHDALITELARYPELTVISRTSVERYKKTKKTLPEIASELHVDGVIEGTVLREGTRVRMNAQLAEGPSGRDLWGESYTRDLRDVLDLQREVAEAIAREVRVAAAPSARDRRDASGTRGSTPDELYLRELYLRGRHAELSRSPVGIQTAKEAYRRSIERDSTFALGYAGLAGVYGFIADYALGPAGPALDSARTMAERSVALDGTLPEAHTALAVTLGDAGRFEAAEREFQRAIELAPSNARAHYWYSILLVALGRGSDALRESRRAATLEPFPPRGMVAMERYAEWLLTGERPHLKLPVTDRRPVLKLEPGEPWARARNAMEFAEEGQCSQAWSEISQAQQLAPDNIRMLAFLGEVSWRCGAHDRARALVRQMARRADANDQGYQLAKLYALFGERDSAFIWLDRQRWTTPKLASLSADVYAEPLRDDPRFGALLLRLGIRGRSPAAMLSSR